MSKQLKTPRKEEAGGYPAAAQRPFRTHYACAELAAMKLPGYPTTKKGWYALVQRDAWEFHDVPGKGGKDGIRREYLPPAKIARLIASRGQIAADGSEARAMQAALAKIRAETKAEKARKTETRTAEIYASLSLTGREKFEAHFDIVLAFRDYFHQRNSDSQRLRRNAAFRAFAEDYNAGRIKVSEVARTRYRTISYRSIQRWALENEQKGLLACADQRAVKGGSGQRKSIIEKHPEIEKFFIAAITEKPHIQSTHLTEVLNELRIARFGADATGEILCPPISYDAVCRYRVKFEAQHAQALMAETNPDGWKNKFMSSLGSQDEAVHRLNQLWLMDGTPADWELTDGRHTASVVLDVWSRRPKILFSKTPRTETNKLLLRAAVLEWGVCDGAKVDNGSDYVSREMMMFFEEMGIEVERCTVFSPWEKGMVERFIKTFLHSLLEVLDNFSGHNVADKKIIEARRSFADNLFKKNAVVKVDMSCAEMQQLADAWVAGTYMMKDHRTLEMSPLEKIASYNGAIKRVANERALDILLAKPERPPVITKKGIRYNKMDFIHAELPLHVGKVADIRLDPNDMGKLIVFVDGKFLCIASNALLAGIDRKEVAAHGREKQKAFIAAKKAEYRKARKALPVSLHDLAIDMVVSRAEKAGKVTVMEKKASAYRTAALEEAARVVAEEEGPKPSGIGQELIAEARRQVAAHTKPRAPVMDLTIRLPEEQAAWAQAEAGRIASINPMESAENPLARMNDDEKFDFWFELDVLARSGAEIRYDWQKRFHAGFCQTPKFKAMRSMREVKAEYRDRN